MAKIGAAPVASPGWTGKPKKGLKIVDCDVHHNISNKDQLMPYLSKIYQGHLLDPVSYTHLTLPTTPYV